MFVLPPPAENQFQGGFKLLQNEGTAVDVKSAPQEDAANMSIQYDDVDDAYIEAQPAFEGPQHQTLTSFPLYDQNLTQHSSLMTDQSYNRPVSTNK